jgi:hypothetical protein
MALVDAKPIESPVGMAVASNALLAGLFGFLIDQNIITRAQLGNIIATAHAEVIGVRNSPAHESAGVVLANLQKRFPVA